MATHRDKQDISPTDVRHPADFRGTKREIKLDQQLNSLIFGKVSVGIRHCQYFDMKNCLTQFLKLLIVLRNSSGKLL